MSGKPINVQLCPLLVYSSCCTKSLLCSPIVGTIGISMASSTPLQQHA